MTRWTEAMRGALRWPERVTVSEWADRHRVLTEMSADPGPWRTSRVPYAREWMDSANQPWVRQVTTLKSTQVAGTESLLNVMAFAIDQDPGPIIYVMPSREDAADFGADRVLPMIRASAALRRHLTRERHDAKRRRIRLRRCSVYLRTARVPSELASRPARWLLLDEVDKWPTWTQKEAGPFELAVERTRTFWNHVIYVNSTPTVAGGLISREFAKGDRRRFHVPCPACGQFQLLRFAQLKFGGIETEEAMRSEKAAWYECEHCQHHITDQQKVAALARGAWLCEGLDWREHVRDGQLIPPEDRHPHRSYHIWAGYSPWVTWWEVAAKWLAAKDDPAARQNFVNSWLGEPWEEKVAEPKSSALLACRDEYLRGQVPPGVLVLTAGADVQKRFLPWVVRGWGLDRESFLIEHGTADTLERLGELLFKRDWTGGDKSRPQVVVRLLMIDARYRTTEVIEWARKWGALVKPSFGVESDDPRPFTPKSVDRNPFTGQSLPNSVIVWHTNVAQFKDVFAAAIERGNEPGPGAFHLPKNVDENYVAEVTAEHKVLVRSGKNARERWVKKPGVRQNHYLDAEVLAFAAAQLIRVDLMRAELARAQARQRARRPDDDERFEEGGGRLWRPTM